MNFNKSVLKSKKILHEKKEQREENKENDAIINMGTNKTNYVAFWGPHHAYGFCSQWYKCYFELSDNIIKTLPEEIANLNLFAHKPNVIQKLVLQNCYNDAEQFMMMSKAALFEDYDIFELMSKSNEPKEQQILERRIKNFVPAIWNQYNIDIVKLGSYLKFSQNDNLKKQLLDTNNLTLVEGSPIDKIWGVGLRYNDPNIGDKTKWKGTNYLGLCLEYVRACL